MIKPDVENNYTRVDKKHKILEKLKQYCTFHSVSLALRGEIYGSGIQGFPSNPHAKLPLNFAAFSVWNIDELKYESSADPHYYTNVANACIDPIPTVPLVERAILTLELIEKYERGITEINGKSFEGVVIKHSKGSFKVINLTYDERK